MTLSTLSDYTQTLKDFYALPGTQLKQYVVDTNREYAWEDATCPRFNVDPHGDADEPCVVYGEVKWTSLGECDICQVLRDKAARETAVKAWLAAKAVRPSIESDRTKLSDEFAAEWPAMRESPLFAMLTKKPTQEPR